MIACQIKVDGEWSIGHIVKDAETAWKTLDQWNEGLGIENSRWTREEYRELPNWNLQQRINGAWEPSIVILHGELRALLVLCSKLVAKKDVDVADWRLVPWVKA
jgi:hypothetical protein